MRRLLRINIVMLFVIAYSQSQNCYISGSISITDSVDAAIVKLFQAKKPDREGGALLITVTDRNTNKRIASADLSLGNYGGLLYGAPVLTLYKEPDSSVLIMVRAVFGGDGERLFDYLILYRFQRGKLFKLYYAGLSYLKFIYADGWLKEIIGTRMYSMTDGYDTSDTVNCFCFPLKLRISSKHVVEECTLTAKERLEMLGRYERRRDEEFKQTTDFGWRQSIDSIGFRLRAYFDKH